MDSADQPQGPLLCITFPLGGGSGREGRRGRRLSEQIFVTKGRSWLASASQIIKRYDLSLVMFRRLGQRVTKCFRSCLALHPALLLGEGLLARQGPAVVPGRPVGLLLGHSSLVSLLLWHSPAHLAQPSRLSLLICRVNREILKWGHFGPQGTLSHVWRHF